MDGIADFRSHPRSEEKRARIVEIAMRLFAEHGYAGARVEDVARALGIAKGSIFQHFGSKEGLFLAVYKAAVRSLSSYLEAPADVVSNGFFATIRYWLERTEHLIREDWIPYRITLLGNYGTDLRVRREINRFLVQEDPYGTAAFVRFGVERGEVRGDIDFEMTVSMLDWLMSSFQDALVTEELDPGLFRHHGDDERRQARIDQFVELLCRAVGAPAEPAADGRRRPAGAGTRRRASAPGG